MLKIVYRCESCGEDVPCILWMYVHPNFLKDGVPEIKCGCPAGDVPCEPKWVYAPNDVHGEGWTSHD